MKIEQIIQNVPQWTGQSFTVTPIYGGLTNETYKVVVLGEAYVMRIGAKNAHLHGIQRSIEYQLMRAAAQVGITPEVIAIFPAEDVCISRFINGRVLTEQDMHQPETIKQIVQIMKGYHALPVPAHPIPFFEIERSLTIVKDDPLISHEEIADLQHLARLLKATLTPSQGTSVVCHNDLAPLNFIDNGQQLWLFDWEYAGAGDCFLDLANFSSHNDFDDAENDLLLRTYFGEYTPAMWAKLKLMGTWSILREALWGLLQRQSVNPESDYARLYLNRFRQARQSPEFTQWLRVVRREVVCQDAALTGLPARFYPQN